MPQEFKLIPDDMYKNLSQEVGLFSFLRNLFGVIDEEMVAELSLQAVKIQESFAVLQEKMLADLKDSHVGTVPLRFVKDYNNRQPGMFLRWREPFSYGTSPLNGMDALAKYLTDPSQDIVLKQSIIDIEKERLVLNMQIGLLNQMIRWLNKTKEEMELLAKVSNGQIPLKKGELISQKIQKVRGGRPRRKPIKSLKS